MNRLRPLFILMAAGILLPLLEGCGKSADQKYSEASARLDSVQNLYAAGRYDESLSLARITQSLFTDIQNDTGEALAELFIGIDLHRLGEYDSARFCLHDAINRLHNVADKRLERKARIALADFDNAMGNQTEALTFSAAAATEARVFSDKADEYRATRILARTRHAMGQYDLERENLEVLLRLDSIVYGGKKGEEIFEAMFSSAAAAGSLQRVQEVVRRWKATFHNDVSACKADFWFAQWQEHTGQLDSAFRSYARVIESLNRVNLPLLQGDVWSALGGLSYRQHRYENARTYFSNALPIARKYHRAGQGVMLELALIATDAQLHAGEKIPALRQRAEKQTDTARALSYRRAEALGLYLSGEFADLSGDRAAAVRAYSAAWRLDLGFPRSKDEFDDLADALLAGEGNGWADRLIRLYISAGAPDSAFALLEERNRRDLAEFFVHSTITTGDPSLTGRIADYQWSRTTCIATEALLRSEFTDTSYFPVIRHESLTRALPELAKKNSAALAALRAVSGNFAILFSSDPLYTRDVRSALTPGSALLEIVPGEPGSTLLVVKGDTVVMRKSPAGRTNFLALARDYATDIAATRLTTFGLRAGEGTSPQRLNELGAALSAALLSPIAADLRGVTKLYVVLPAECSWLPVQTLRTPEGPLGLRINVSYLPSAAALLFTLPAEHATRTVVGMGHRGKTDWDVEYEVKDIRAFYDKAPVLFDTAATLSHLLPLKYDGLQMTAEFYLDTDVPDNSHVVLADSETSYGTSNVPLGELCSVPAPQMLFFSNIASVPGGFRRYPPYLLMANGTRTVIASMWQGDRRTIKAFGEGLYTHLVTGSPVSDAFQQAITEMGKGEMNQIQNWGLFVQYGR